MFAQSSQHIIPVQDLHVFKVNIIFPTGNIVYEEPCQCKCVQCHAKTVFSGSLLTRGFYVLVF